MNEAEQQVVDDFRESSFRARECLALSNIRLSEEIDEVEISDIMDDCRWAAIVLISEKVLLEAFRETPETSLMEIAGLISHAEDKIENANYVASIVDYLISVKAIPGDIMLNVNEMNEMIRSVFDRVAGSLLSNDHSKSTVSEGPPYPPGRSYVTCVEGPSSAAYSEQFSTW